MLQLGLDLAVEETHSGCCAYSSAQWSLQLGLDLAVEETQRYETRCSKRGFLLQLGLDLAVEETQGERPNSKSRIRFNWASTSRSRKPDLAGGFGGGGSLQLGLDLAVE